MEEASERYEVRNLIGILSALKQIEEPDMNWSDLALCHALDAKNATTKDLKDDLTEMLITHVVPIGKKINDFNQDQMYLSTVLRDGSDKAREIAEITMTDVRGSMGLV